jgi:uncharacterized membrane protein
MSDAPQSTTDSGLPENLASALCYVLGLVSGLIFILIEKKNQTVRYHAVQSILVTIVLVLVSVVIGILGFILAFIPVVGPLVIFLLSLVMGLGSLACWLGLMFLAFTGRKIKIPMLSDLAEKYSQPGAI